MAPWTVGAVALFVLVSDPPKDIGHFERYRPLSLSELYEKRMRFSGQKPLVSIGIMEGAQTVDVFGRYPLRLSFFDGDTPQTVYSAGGQRFRFEVVRGTAATLRYWIVVRAVRAKDRAVAEEEALRWSRLGFETKVFEVGTVLGLRGNVLDTRELRVGVDGGLDLSHAERKTRELAAQTPSQLFVHEELVALPTGTIAIVDASKKVVGRAKDVVHVGTVKDGSVRVAGVEHERLHTRGGRRDREFLGELYVVADRRGKLALVNSVEAEKMLRGLVPAEIFPDAPLEALKAQAVTARGEVFSKLAHRHFGDPFHLCSKQHCQVYKGLGDETARTDQAVRETLGLLAFKSSALAGDGLALVDSVYSSNCGGISESNETVWGTPPSPSLRSKLDAVGEDPAFNEFRHELGNDDLTRFLSSFPPAACARSNLGDKRKFRWTRVFSKEQIDRIVRPFRIGTLRDVLPIGRGPGGRVTGLRLVGRNGSHEVLRELAVRRTFDNLNSGLFVLGIEKNAQGDITSLRFTGGGWGHGVGMCQMGAVGRAELGQSFQQILSHYYDGAVTLQIYE